MQHLSGHHGVVTLKAVCGGCISRRRLQIEAAERDEMTRSQGLHIPAILDFVSNI